MGYYTILGSLLCPSMNHPSPNHTGYVDEEHDVSSSFSSPPPVARSSISIHSHDHSLFVTRTHNICNCSKQHVLPNLMPKFYVASKPSIPKSPKPTLASQALKIPYWHDVMFKEFDALIHNRIRELVPTIRHQNLVECK